jgi:KDO2-lipid IV(A) lauroyltransferase
LKAQRHKVEALLLSTLAKSVARLSRERCAGVSRLLGRIGFALDPRGRSVAIENLRCVFGEALSPKERVRIARESYQWFVRTMGDLFWSPRLCSADILEKIVRIDGLDHFKDAPKGTIVAIPHLAGFEWVPIATALSGYTGIGVAEPFKNPLLATIFDDLRSTGGNVVYEQAGVAVRFFRQLKRGGTIGVLADLSQPPGDASVIIESFGMVRSVPAITAMLHLRTGAPILPAEPEVFADGTMKITFGPPVAFPENTPTFAVAQALWDLEEAVIRKRPSHFLWAYKYWRHLPQGVGGRYPSYAKPSKRFDKAFREQQREPCEPVAISI